MKALRLLTIVSVCCAIGTLSTTAWAAEPAPAKPATPAASESAAPKANEPASSPAEKPAAQGAPKQGTQNPAAQNPATQGQGTQDEEAPPAPSAAKSKGSGKGGSPERFVPSEQVRADFDVSFPIDI